MIRGTVMIDILRNLYLHHIQIIGITLISVNGVPDDCQCFGDSDIHTARHDQRTDRNAEVEDKFLRGNPFAKNEIVATP